jgi:hypothetical protein
MKGQQTRTLQGRSNALHGSAVEEQADRIARASNFKRQFAKRTQQQGQ